MSHTPTTHPEPGPECFCGSELKSVPLPADLRALADRDSIWIHVHNGDTRCYAEAAEGLGDPEDIAATAEPADCTPGASLRRGDR
jgi:hypothetical protein